MTTHHHGISIGIERHRNDIFLTLKPTGKLTHDDYQSMSPMIDAAVKEVDQPHIRALIDASELDGWEIRAAWDDFKLGLKHGRKFEKIAIYGDKDWLKSASKIGNWFVAGQVNYFSDRESSLDWLAQR